MFIPLMCVCVFIKGSHVANKQLVKDNGEPDIYRKVETDMDKSSARYKKVDPSSTENINACPKSPKIKSLPQMLLSDRKLKRSNLMTRRESQALLEGVRKNKGLQNTQSCLN